MFDTYAYAENDDTYNRRILGDATGEMGPFATATYGTQNRQIGSWYANNTLFAGRWYPWFYRGNVYSAGSGTGVFSFGVSGGGVSFRVVLSF